MAEENKQEPGGTPDPTEGFKTLLAKHNSDAMAVAAMLYQDNYQAREKARQLQADNEAMKAKIPAEGSAVIPGDKAKLLELYEKLGKPEDLGQLQGELAAMRKAQIVAQAAAAHGFKSKVLGDLAAKATIEMREVEKDGKKQSAAFVLEEGGKATPLPEYAADHWADYLPALADAHPERKIQPGNGGDPKPANMAGMGKADNEARESYARTIRAW
jgi:hypothetical protein